MRIEKYLSQTRKKIDTSLKQNLPLRQDRVSRAMRYAVFSGGKRLRPILFLATAESLGGRDNKTTMVIASAIEFIHTFSLIQDDLPSMDNDDYRRGKLTVHNVFSEDMAILASDALLNKAYRMVIECGSLTQQLKVRILFELMTTVENLIAGQEKDLGLVKKGEIALLELKEIYLKKTSVLIAVCMKIAGILRGMNYGQIRRLNSVGDKLGLAYQISDDILNIVGNKRVFKGRVLSDKKSGKITYPAILGIERAQDVSAIFIKEAKGEIQKINNMDKEKLFGLCDFILKRTY